MKKTLLILCITVLIVLLVGCDKDNQVDQPSDDRLTESGTESSDSGSDTSSESVSESAEDKNQFVIANGSNVGDFHLIYDTFSTDTAEIAMRLQNALKDTTGKMLRSSDFLFLKEPVDKQIMINCLKNEETKQIYDSLGENEYVIKAIRSDSTPTEKIIFVYRDQTAGVIAMKEFIKQFVTKEGTVIPADLEIRGKFSESDYYIVSNIDRFRDPCVLIVDGVYYVYGTGWGCYKNTSGALDGNWEYVGVVAKDPENVQADRWAPEVHAYNGAYYMFTTYRSSVTGRHGCTIMRSDSPEGPFVEITNGHVTPAEWDSIDGTFYVDPDGQPWMIFVHEWVSTSDKVGRMAAAKLSDDLTHFISEPIELFRADDPSWAKSGVTDGCWMYRTSDGQLLKPLLSRVKCVYLQFLNKKRKRLKFFGLNRFFHKCYLF